MSLRSCILFLLAASNGLAAAKLYLSACPFAGSTPDGCVGGAEINQPVLALYAHLKGSTFSNAAQISYQSSGGTQPSLRQTTYLDPTDLSFVLLPSDVGAVGKGILTIADGANSYSAQLAVYPRCGDVLQSTTNAVGTLVQAQSNGRDFGTGTACGTDPVDVTWWKGAQLSNYGDAYECPEFVRRYYDGLVDQQHDPTLEVWRGDAITYYDQTTAANRGLVLYCNNASTALLDCSETTPPEIGDIIVFQEPGSTCDNKGHCTPKDPTGHVAIIDNVSDTTITVIEQNFNAFGGRSINYDKGTNTVQFTDGFNALGWLRSANPPSNNQTTGQVKITASVDNIPLWTGPVTCQVSGPVSFPVNQIPSPMFSATEPEGTYSVSCTSGGPLSAILSSITPNSQQKLDPGGSIMFSLNFALTACFSDAKVRFKSSAFATAQDSCPPSVSPLFVSCSCSPNPATVNQATTCSAATSGGLAPFQYTWTSGGLNIGSSQSISRSYSSPGLQLLNLSVSDSTAVPQLATSVCSIEVQPPAAFPVLSSLVPDRAPVVSQPFDLTINGAGFAPGVAVYFCPSQGACQQNPVVNSVSSTQLFLPNVQWNAAATLTVQAVNPGNLQSNTLPLMIGPLLSGSCLVNGQSNPITLQVGQQATFLANTSGGTLPLSYGWFGINASNSISASQIYSTPGTYNVSVVVADSAAPKAQQIALSCPPVTVTPPPPLSAFCNLNPLTITLGGGSTIFAGAVGGYPPYQFLLPGST